MIAMLGYTKTMALLEEMKAHFGDGFTSSERGVIENLYSKVCNKPIRRSGCSDCYRDAYVELFTKLKRLGTMPTTPNYVLKAGVVISDGFGSSNFYILGNIPDEVAERRLAQRPEDISLFERTPSDWEERVKKISAVDSEEESTAQDDNVAEETSNASTADSEEETKESEKPRRGRPSNK